MHEITEYNIAVRFVKEKQPRLQLFFLGGLVLLFASEETFKKKSGDFGSSKAAKLLLSVSSLTTKESGA